MSGLLTTSVGSFPKPPELQAARNKMLRGELGRDELEQMEREATAFWIKSQEELGIDILVDGEMDRGDMVTYFSELLDGFTISGLVRSYGNRYYRKPIAVGPIGRKVLTNPNVSSRFIGPSREFGERTVLSPMKKEP